MDNLNNLKEKCIWARNFFLNLDRKKSDNGSIESSTFPEEIILLTDVSIRSYRKFCKKKQKLNLFIRLIKGKIIAYEIPSFTHGIIQSKMISLMSNWHDQLEIMSKLDLFIEENGFCADITISPTGAILDPTMIVEIGIFESLQSLHDLAKNYFSEKTNIQVYLALKIWPLRQDNCTAAMLALLYLRDNWVQIRPGHIIWSENKNPNMVISFGNAPLNNDLINFLNGKVRNDRCFGYFEDGDTICNDAGIPIYQMPIPANLLFTDNPDVPVAISNNYNLDLWTIQNKVLHVLVQKRQREL